MTEVRERPVPKGLVGKLKLRRDIKGADRVVAHAEKKQLITHPMARFNLNLDNQNPDWEAVDGTQSPAHTKKEETRKGEKVRDPETGQRFNVIKLNWERFNPQAHSRVLVFMPPYNNAINTGATNYRLEQLGRQIDGPVLSIDHPSMGRSDKLTEEQRLSLSTTVEGYGAIAEAELRVMKEMGVTDIDLIGQSMGGWAVASLARKAELFGIKVHTLIVIDSPGLKEMQEGLFGGELTSAEMSEGKYLDLYQSAPYDPEMRLASGQQHSTARKKIGLARWALSSFANDPGGIYRKAMGTKFLNRDLREALRRNPDLKVIIANGTLSEISPSDANAKLVQTLAKQFQGRVSQAMFPGEPHTVMEPAKRFASFVKTIIQR